MRSLPPRRGPTVLKSLCFPFLSNVQDGHRLCSCSIDNLLSTFYSPLPVSPPPCLTVWREATWVFAIILLCLDNKSANIEVKHGCFMGPGPSPVSVKTLGCSRCLLTLIRLLLTFHTAPGFCFTGLLKTLAGPVSCRPPAYPPCMA